MATNERIWFQLVDAHGNPYRGTTATSKRFHDDCDVCDFRKVVKVTFSTTLSSMDASTLLVYKNRSSFDKRNDPQSKVEPLEEDSLINSLGETEDDALIVVVPLSSMYSQIQPSPFLTCKIPFYRSILEVTDRNRWISFPYVIPSTTLTQLYIRECYETIASSIETGFKTPVITSTGTSTIEFKKAIVTGTPGIGKSIFLIYLLWKLVRTGKRVLIIFHPHSIYYDGQGGVFELTTFPSVVNHEFWNKDLWCLFDAKEKFPSDLGRLPYSECAFVLSTFPRREMVNDFKKPPVPQVFYMPLWNEKELETISSKFPNAGDWHDRFRILGGIPRHVLESTRDDPTELLQAACKQCDLKDCSQIIGLHSSITDVSALVHSLVHITSTYPFTESIVTYASETALDIIVTNNAAQAKRKMVELLESSAWNPLTASLCRYIFEPFALELLENGGVFPCRQLAQENTESKPLDTFLTIPTSIRMVVDKVELGQSENQLYVPRTKNGTSIDAWIPGIGAFRMTVGKPPDINGGVTDDLVLLGTNKLFWLLPPLYFNSFTKKSPQDIDQYAVKIPYPGEDE
jgi:hypothetical protein